MTRHLLSTVARFAAPDQATGGDTIPAFLKRDQPSAPEGKPAATEVKSDRKVPDTNATTKAEADAKKPRAKKAAAPKTPAVAKKAKSRVTEAQVEQADADGQKLPHSVVPVKYKKAYAATDNTCGDELALYLKKYTTIENKVGRDTMDTAKLAEVAKANDQPIVGVNAGLQRMNLSNRLRGMLKHGQTVTVGGRKFAGKGKDTVALRKTPEAIEARAQM